MAYGDNRSSVATDDFSSGISGSWTNGDGDWSPMSAGGSDYAELSTTSNDCAMRRTGETFADDQYSESTVQNFGTGSSDWYVVTVRMQSGADESCYHGLCTTSAGDSYRINEIDSSFGFNNLVTDNGFGGTLANGDTVTLEAEGTTLRLGTNESGGGDTEKTTATDATITSGEPGLGGFGNPVGAIQHDAWDGGDIGAVAVAPNLLTLLGVG